MTRSPGQGELPFGRTALDPPAAPAQPLARGSQGSQGVEARREPLGPNPSDPAFLEPFGEDLRPGIGLLEESRDLGSLKPLDRFNEATGSVLASAYEKFPGEVAVQLSGLNEGTSDLYRDTLKWLHAEDYIRMDRYTADYYRVSLTGKGLAVLTTTPSSLHPAKESVGDAMLEEVKKGGREALGKLAKEALDGGVKLLGSVAAQHAVEFLKR